MDNQERAKYKNNQQGIRTNKYMQKSKLFDAQDSKRILQTRREAFISLKTPVVPNVEVINVSCTRGCVACWMVTAIQNRRMVSACKPSNYLAFREGPRSTLLSKPSTLARKPLTISRICLTLSNSTSSSSICCKIARNRAISASAIAMALPAWSCCACVQI